jgi:hypothetical protein
MPKDLAYNIGSPTTIINCWKKYTGKDDVTEDKTKNNSEGLRLLRYNAV